MEQGRGSGGFPEPRPGNACGQTSDHALASTAAIVLFLRFWQPSEPVVAERGPT
jgi:hypothetical protein